jgi:bifunctional DNA-binding transcriptional regulator/antitoxin component of YhaV-PrlF toxin-antitoxin module
MTLFDAPSRETCIVRRARTDTPIQALVLMNDETYVEAARGLAERMIEEGGRTPDSRLDFAYRVVLARYPSAAERKILETGLGKRLEHYKANPDAAKKLLSEGDLKNPSNVNPAEEAAYTIAASTILNLDETVTKE